MAEVKCAHSDEFDADIYTFEGELSYKEAHDAVTGYYKGKLTKYVVADFSKAKVDKLTHWEIRHLAELIQDLGKVRAGCADILIAPGPLLYGLARIYSAYVQPFKHERDALKTLIFRDIKDAMSFIDVDSAGKNK